MRILMLGNSLTSAQDMPDILAELTGAEVVCHTRGGARLSEHLNPNTRLGARTQAALAKEQWDYVVLQEMSHGPITAPGSFFASVERLCRQIRENGAIPVLYATWAYQKGGARLSAKGWDYGGMARNLSAAYRRAAEENRALLADVGRRFYQLPGTQDLYAADGVHPSGQGARIAAETIAAAIQRHKDMIGVNKRIIAFDNQGGYMVMFNPEIVKRAGPYEAEEGCLSLSGTRRARRWESIKVRWQNEKFQERIKTFTGWTAQIIQHEIDHCEGIII